MNDVSDSDPVSGQPMSFPTFGSQLHADEYVTGATPVINPVHMVNGKIVPSEEITVTDEVL